MHATYTDNIEGIVSLTFLAFIICHTFIKCLSHYEIIWSFIIITLRTEEGCWNFCEYLRQEIMKATYLFSSNGEDWGF